MKGVRRDRAALDRAILDALGRSPEPLSVWEIWRAIYPAALSDQTVRHALDDLARRGGVVRRIVTRTAAVGHGFAAGRFRTTKVAVFTTATTTTTEESTP